MPGQVGPRGSGSSTTFAMETPSGVIDGVNNDFVFTAPPVQVFYQGVLQNGGDYTLAGSTVTFDVPPVDGTILGLVPA